jgi:putative N6-adenine-specific DNA methylase
VSSSSDKPKRSDRPTIRIKRDEEAAASDSVARSRKPLRGRHQPADKRGVPGARVRPPAVAEAPGEAEKRPARDKTPAAGRPRSGQPEQSAPRQRPRQAPPKPVVHAYFAPCPRGLEAELARELDALGAADPRVGPGGVAFRGELPLAWKVNLWSRLAIRVLQQVGEGSYASEDDLYQAALRLPWPDWFSFERSIAVHTAAHASPLKSLNFATLRIKDGVCDRFRQDLGARPDVDTRAPQVPILLYLREDRYTLYLDLSGEPLNRRGYRVQPAAAPLNENLAAGLLRLSGWTPGEPLLDPMMGGGTLLLEAAMMALNIPPGLKRHFAFEHLASFDRTEWMRLRKDAELEMREKRPLPIHGRDIDPAMVRAAGLNLKAAGLLECVDIDQADVLELAPPAANGFIVSNPPYGVRLEDDDLTGFYKQLGDVLKQRFTGWRANLLSADPRLPKAIGLRTSRRTPLFNGPLECRLYEYRLVAGEMRGKGTVE